jgi:hypothetical protein
MGDRDKKRRTCIVCHKKKAIQSFRDEAGVHYKVCKECREIKNGKSNEKD